MSPAGPQRRQQELMHEDQIDAQAVVAPERALPIVPPAERFFRLLEVAEGIDQSDVADGLQRGALFRAHVHAAHPRRRVVHVTIFGRDVEVA